MRRIAAVGQRRRRRGKRNLLAAVTNLAVVNNGNGTWTATWTDAVGATSYEVYLDGVLQNTVLQGVGTFSGPFSGAGSVDVAALPVANRQLPDWTTYNALGMPSRPAGYVYGDPATSVRIIKLTDANTPIANTLAIHDYANGGPYASCVWDDAGDETVTVMIEPNSSGAHYFQDQQLHTGAAPSNVRVTPIAIGPSCSGFSTVPATWYYWYTIKSGILRRWDVRTGEETPGSNFPKDLTGVLGTSDTWLTVAHGDTRFCMIDNTGGIAVFEPATNTVWNTTDIALTGGLYSLDEAYLSPSGRYVVALFGAGLWKLWDLETGFTSEMYTPSPTFNHPDFVWDGTTEWFIGLDPDTAAGSNTCVSVELAPILANDQALPAVNAEHVGFMGPNNHTAANWTLGNTDGVALFSSFGESSATPSLIHNGAGFVDAAGTVLRLLCHGYGSDVQTYQDMMMASNNADGRVVLFKSNMGTAGGRVDTFLAVVPTS